MSPLPGVDPENELGRGQCRGSPAGSRGAGPVVGLGTPEADDFSHLKGYLDATSGILGRGMAPCPPLKSATDLCRVAGNTA